MIAKQGLRNTDFRVTGYLLTQGFIIYGVGIRLYTTLIGHLASETVVGVCFLVCAIASGLVAESFHRVIDQPSRVVPHVMFRWLIA